MSYRFCAPNFTHFWWHYEISGRSVMDVVNLTLSKRDKIKLKFNGGWIKKFKHDTESLEYQFMGKVPSQQQPSLLRHFLPSTTLSKIMQTTKFTTPTRVAFSTLCLRTNRLLATGHGMAERNTKLSWRVLYALVLSGLIRFPCVSLENLWVSFPLV